MTKSTSLLLFPDLNVWLALSVARHKHHSLTAAWLQTLDDSQRLCFCRFTQLGLFRLLTTEQVMGEDEVQTQRQAWEIYEQWLADERVLFVEEPSSLEIPFRKLTQLARPAPKEWADSYLIAFALAAGLRLVTLDKGMSHKAIDAIFLDSE